VGWLESPAPWSVVIFLGVFGGYIFWWFAKLIDQLTDKLNAATERLAALEQHIADMNRRR
jgi:hypothetical protein